MKKKPLLFLMFLCILMLPVICRAEASASEKLKDLSFTTPTHNVGELSDDVTITTDFGLTDDYMGDNNKYKVAISITPIYESVWISSDSGRVNLATEPDMLKLINKKVTIYNPVTYNHINPVYDSNGLVSSFSQTFSSVEASDLMHFTFTVTLPDNYSIESIYREHGEDVDIDSVDYSVKFKVNASVYLESGASPNVKLNKTSVSGYVNYIYYLTEMVDNQRGNYKIVKASSSNSAIASVSSSTGKITMKKTGTCTITVTNAYGKSASFKVIVKPSVISRQRKRITCSLGTKMNLSARGAVLLFGTPKYKVKSSKRSVVSVQKKGNEPIIRGKKIGSAVLTFTCGNKKFSIRVKVRKAKVVIASSATLQKGDSRTLSANESSDDIYIKKATSINGLLSLNLSSNARALTLTANKSFSGTSASDKVVVTFSNGKKKTIKVKLTQPKTKKKFSLDDVKITLRGSYWNGSKSCLKYTITNNSSKNLTKLKIYYTGVLNEEVDGYINVNSSIPRGKSKTFTTKLDYFDYLDEATLTLVSAS